MGNVDSQFMQSCKDCLSKMCYFYDWHINRYKQDIVREQTHIDIGKSIQKDSVIVLISLTGVCNIFCQIWFIRIILS